MELGRDRHPLECTLRVWAPAFPPGLITIPQAEHKQLDFSEEEALSSGQSRRWQKG